SEFLKVWQLPESERLRVQTLDKLALAWKPEGTNPPPTTTNYAPLVHENASATLLRPLLDDIVQQECYLEIRDQSDKQGQVVLAIRLDAARSGIWETNLAQLIESTTGTSKKAIQSTDGSVGWEVQVNNPSTAISGLLKHVQFVRSGDWTFVGLAPGQNS